MAKVVIVFSFLATFWCASESRSQVISSSPLLHEGEVIVSIKIASVDLELGGAYMPNVYDYSFTGSSDDSPIISYKTYKEGREGVLTIRRNIGDADDEGDRDSRFGFSDLFGRGSGQGTARLLLSTDVPVSIDLTSATGTSSIDVSGIKLRRLSMQIGAGEGSLECKTKNSIRSEVVNVSVGAASANLSGLGNLNAKQINVSTSAGKLDLDFSGDLQKETGVNINVTAGFVNISIPRNFGVKIVLSGKTLSSISLPNMNPSSDGHFYTNRNYGYSDASLFIKLSVGAGKVKLEWW